MRVWVEKQGIHERFLRAKVSAPAPKGCVTVQRAVDEEERNIGNRLGASE
jgi:hypothetical protein